MVEIGGGGVDIYTYFQCTESPIASKMSFLGGFGRYYRGGTIYMGGSKYVGDYCIRIEVKWFTTLKSLHY